MPHPLQAGDVALVQQLLECGADPSALDGESRGTAEVARAAGHDQLALLCGDGAGSALASSDDSFSDESSSDEEGSAVISDVDASDEDDLSSV
mgnify:CR=1 FL=1|jgi:hypothetical protein